MSSRKSPTYTICTLYYTFNVKKTVYNNVRIITVNVDNNIYSEDAIESGV